MYDISDIIETQEYRGIKEVQNKMRLDNIIQINGKTREDSRPRRR